MCPRYDYECSNNHQFERDVKLADLDKPLESCPECGAEVKKSISAHAGYFISGGNGASTRPRGSGSFKK
jgi:putative FmdB family regulatory protein